MNELTVAKAIMTKTVKDAGTRHELREGDTVWVQRAVNQPNHFTKYFASPCSPERASFTDRHDVVWVCGEEALLIEREEFELFGDEVAGVTHIGRERDDREAARLYRAHCLDTEFKVNWYATDWPHELMRAFLLGPVAREAAIWPECKVRTANIARTEGWTPETRVNVALRSAPTSPNIGHWDCRLTRYREVAR